MSKSKSFCIAFISFLSIYGYSQSKMFESKVLNHPVETRVCKSSFISKPLKQHEDKELAIYEFLLDFIPSLNSESVDIKLIKQINSPGGEHFTFVQLLYNVPIYSATIKVNIDKNNTVKSILDNSFEISESVSEKFPDKKYANEYLTSKGIGKDDLELFQVENTYFFDGELILPALEVRVMESPAVFYTLIWSSTGEILYKKDLVKYHHFKSENTNVDSVITARIFLPDPLTSAGVTYGAPYMDSSDSDVQVLLDELVDTTIRVTYDNGYFRLISDYVYIKDLDTPTKAPAYSSSPDLSFTRAQDGFEDVNAYFYINTFQEHIQSLGFMNLVNYSIQTDPHALNGGDNSSFTGNGTSSYLLFGEGNVDDAEDADVILHEYGHAILHSALSSATSGVQLGALDEANGDYFAVSYSRNVNPYEWDRVFSWDGHNEFWDGRWATSNKTYPDDLSGSIYTDAEIWSSTLMQIWEDIGRDTADMLLLQTLYSFSNNMTMSDAASLYLLSDSLLFNGVHSSSINYHMCNRGFFSPCSTLVNNMYKQDESIKILNSMKFAEGENICILFSDITDYEYKMFSIDGKLISGDKGMATNNIYIKGSNLHNGVYILKLNYGNNFTSFKIVR